ncbi:unnamed protein product, partial [Allacma fusca]
NCYSVPDRHMLCLCQVTQVKSQRILHSIEIRVKHS